MWDNFGKIIMLFSGNFDEFEEKFIENFMRILRKF